MDAWLIKTDSMGDTSWTRSYSMWHDYKDWTLGQFHVENDIVYQLPDEGYIIGGSTKYPCGTYYNAWLIKTDAVGNKIWSRFYGDEHTWLGDFKITSDGGFIIALGGNSDILLKTDINGDTVWVKDYTAGKAEYISSVAQTHDKGFIFSVNAGDESRLMKVDSSGTLMWKKTYAEGYTSYIRSISQTNDRGYILLGEMIYTPGDYDIWVIKTDSAGNTSDLTSLEQRNVMLRDFIVLQNYPNPFNPKTYIEYRIPGTEYVVLSVYDLLGRKVATLVDKNQVAGNYQVQWDASGFASGIYYYHLRAGKHENIKKMVLIK